MCMVGIICSFPGWNRVKVGTKRWLGRIPTITPYSTGPVVFTTITHLPAPAHHHAYPRSAGVRARRALPGVQQARASSPLVEVQLPSSALHRACRGSPSENKNTSANKWLSSKRTPFPVCLLYFNIKFVQCFDEFFSSDNNPI